jgi:hypothetical protein
VPETEVAASHELRQLPVGPGTWAERHRLLVVVDSPGRAPLVLATQVGYHLPRAHFSFQAMVAEGAQLPLVISENEIPGPDQGWELRSSGLWVDHVCETPMDHWSYGLESFALAIDDPIELLGQGFGQRTPLGWELEFEAGAAPTATGPQSYCQPGIVHGLLLGPGRQVEIEGRALRGHAWGHGGGVDDALHGGPPGRQLGDRLDEEGDEVLVEVALPTPESVWWVARTPTGVRTRGV